MDPYASAGVDEEREQDVFATAMRPWLARTAVRSQLVTSITGLASGYFATLMHVPPGPPIALTTDGVGTKILLAREADRWEPVGIDCVANNVNDVICTGAVPLALLDYIATDRIDAAVLEALGVLVAVDAASERRLLERRLRQLRALERLQALVERELAAAAGAQPSPVPFISGASDASMPPSSS